VYGLGIWPMVRPHCISSSVRFPSHFDPVKKPLSRRLSVKSTMSEMLAKSPRNQLGTVLFTHGSVERKSRPLVSAGPALASSRRAGARLRKLSTSDFLLC